ncbi:protein EXECUTER 1, chloroplastic-like isoform X2 [Salvia splendens]|uniref:protein EXECUTER 1, chloroplastic-like isoform X2 n=1 Tax=Salvia splendens TaxID=180675 RepID=UPI001C26412E|nr:protein EXECUTER 1, chloroplastic-like isoform X2 [Salvia splendens]
MSHLKRSVEEERYGDAALIRDHAGAGLVGWWAGTSEDANDPYGRIIHMSAEHGRYIARSYSPRLLDIEVRENWPSLEFKILDGLMHIKGGPVVGFVYWGS